MFIQCLDQVMIHKKNQKSHFLFKFTPPFPSIITFNKISFIYSVFFVLTNYYLFKVQDRCVLLSALEIHTCRKSEKCIKSVAFQSPRWQFSWSEYWPKCTNWPKLSKNYWTSSKTSERFQKISNKMEFSKISSKQFLDETRSIKSRYWTKIFFVLIFYDWHCWLAPLTGNIVLIRCFKRIFLFSSHSWTDV